MQSFIKNEEFTSILFVLIFVLLAAGIIISGYFAYRNYEKNYRTEVERQLSSIAELKVNQLDQWRKERLGNANLFYRNSTISVLVKRFFNNPKDIEAKKSLETWIDKVAMTNNYNRVCLHDSEGIERLSYPKTTIHPPLEFLTHSSEAMESGHLIFHDFFRDENDQQVYLNIFIPVLDEGDASKVLGVISIRIDPTRYLYPFIQSWPTPSKTSETLIIRRDGDDALFLNELRFQKNTSLNLRSPASNKDLPAMKAAMGQQGIVDGLDYRGVPVVADVRAVPDSPWFLVAKTDIEEVYAPIRERLWMMILLVVTLLLSSGTGLGLIWRYQQNRFYREQYHSAEALMESEQKFRETITNLDEGFYSVTMDGHLLEHNQSFNRILGFETSMDLKGMKLPDFWQNPDERNAYLQEFSANGSISNYQINAKTQTGEKITVLASAHLVKDRDNNPLRIEGVFLDITERIRAEEVLRKSEKRLRLRSSARTISRACSEGKSQSEL